MTSSRSLLGRKQSVDSDSDGEEDEFDEGEEDDEQIIQEQKAVSLWDDILMSFYQARFTAPLLAILAIVFAYQLTIAPYRTDTAGVSTTNDMNELVQHGIMFDVEKIVSILTADSFLFFYRGTSDLCRRTRH